MSLSDDIRSRLEGDAALMALLTGGVFDDVEEISRENTPSAFDTNKEIKPCTLIKYGTETRRGPYTHGVQTPLTLYFYERQGFETIKQVLPLVYALLADAKIGAATWNVEFENEIAQLRDTALDCALASQRYVAVRRKA